MVVKRVNSSQKLLDVCKKGVYSFAYTFLSILQDFLSMVFFKVLSINGKISR